MGVEDLNSQLFLAAGGLASATTPSFQESALGSPQGASSRESAYRRRLGRKGRIRRFSCGVPAPPPNNRRRRLTILAADGEAAGTRSLDGMTIWLKHRPPPDPKDGGPSAVATGAVTRTILTRIARPLQPFWLSAAANPKETTD